MDSNKTLFQKISTEMESLLEQYKNQYPKNLAQMIRHNFGKIAICLMCAVVMIGLFSMSITVCLFYFVGLPGTIIFILTIAFSHKKERADDEYDLLPDIKKLEDQLQPLSTYPDVVKYREGFDQKLELAIAEKTAIKKTFKRYALTAAVIAAGIFVVFNARIEITKQMGQLDAALSTDDDNYVEDVLDISIGEPFVTLAPLHEGVATADKPLDFFIEGTRGFREIAVRKVDIRDTAAIASSYLLVVTDLQGRHIPRIPTFRLDPPNTSAGRYVNDEKLRILKYLKDHQKDLRYKVERL